MGGRADGGGEATADADHQGDEEGEGLVAEFLGSLVHDGEEHGACCRVGDELGDEGADQADGGHDDNGISAADVEDACSKHLGDACLLDGCAKDDGAGKDHQDIPVDGFHGLVRGAAAQQEHCKGCE